MLRTLKNRLNATPVEVRASVVYVACDILQKCLSLITMPLFTRLMTPEQIGEMTVYNSWSSTMTLFLTLYMAYGTFSTAMVRFEKDRTGYISSIQTIAAVLCGAFLLIYLPFRGFFNGLFSMSTGLVCLMVAEILAKFALGCWIALKRFEFKYIGPMIATLILIIASPLLAIYLVINSQDKGTARIVGYALVNLVLGGALLITNLVKGKKIVSKEYWKFALTFNIPLIPYYLSQVLLNQSDRIMIEKMVGKAEVGLYGVAYNMAITLTFVLNAINNSYVPWFYNKIKEGKTRENRAITNGLTLLMAFVLMAIISLAPEIIAIMGGAEYASAVWVIPPVTVSQLLLMYLQYFVNVQFYYEAKHMLVWGSIGAAVLNIILNWLCIPVFGFVAAGYTTMFSYMAFVVANFFTYRWVLKKNGQPDDAFDYKVLMLIFLGFCGLTAIAMALYDQPIIRYMIIAAVLLGLAVNYKAVKAFIQKTVIRKE